LAKTLANISNWFALYSLEPATQRYNNGYFEYLQGIYEGKYMW
jgi:hypothetical protein